MSIRNIILVLLVLFLVGSFPVWPYSQGWGYGPGGAIGFMLMVFVVLAVVGRI